MGPEVLIIAIVILGAIIVIAGVCIVPQQQAFVVERLGKYHKTMQAGVTYIVPFNGSHSIQAYIKGTNH